MTNEPRNPQAKPDGAYRVLHSADWHLGKKLGDFSRTEEHERFLDWLLETIVAQQIDALIVAGDIFDSGNPPQSAVRHYFGFLAELNRRTDCEVIITSGNHDSPLHLDAPREALKALKAHVIGGMPEDVADAIIPLPSSENPQVVIAAIPFLRDRDLRSGRLGEETAEIQRELREGIANRYGEAAAACDRPEWRGAGRIAIGHLTVQGSKVSESERDIHIGGLGEVDSTVFPDSFDYVALGHLHRPQRIEESARICYSGSPIPLSFSESRDNKTVRLLDFANGKLIENQKLAIPVFRYLVQFESNRAELEHRLVHSDLPQAELQTWVELIVETSEVAEHIFEHARQLTEDKPFAIIKNVIKRLNEPSRLTENQTVEQSIESLLDNPIDVFDRKLEQQADLTEDEIAALRDVFAQLIDLEQQSEPDEESSDSQPKVSVAAGENAS